MVFSFGRMRGTEKFCKHVDICSLGFSLSVNLTGHTDCALLSSQRYLVLNCKFHTHTKKKTRKEVRCYQISLKKPESSLLLSPAFWIMEAEIIPRNVRIKTVGKGPLERHLNLLLCNCKNLPPCLYSWLGINKVHSSEELDSFTFLQVWWGIKRSQVAINAMSVICFTTRLSSICR